jgi:hypothetical protein
MRRISSLVETLKNIAGPHWHRYPPGKYIWADVQIQSADRAANLHGETSLFAVKNFRFFTSRLNRLKQAASCSANIQCKGQRNFLTGFFLLFALPRKQRFQTRRDRPRAPKTVSSGYSKQLIIREILALFSQSEVHPSDTG